MYLLRITLNNTKIINKELSCYNTNDNKCFDSCGITSCICDYPVDHYFLSNDYDKLQEKLAKYSKRKNFVEFSLFNLDEINLDGVLEI